MCICLGALALFSKGGGQIKLSNTNENLYNSAWPILLNSYFKKYLADFSILYIQELSVPTISQTIAHVLFVCPVKHSTKKHDSCWPSQGHVESLDGVVESAVTYLEI